MLKSRTFESLDDVDDVVKTGMLSLYCVLNHVMLKSRTFESLDDVDDVVKTGMLSL